MHLDRCRGMVVVARTTTRTGFLLVVLGASRALLIVIIPTFQNILVINCFSVVTVLDSLIWMQIAMP